MFGCWLVFLIAVGPVNFEPQYSQPCPDNCKCETSHKDADPVIDIQRGDRNLTNVPPTTEIYIKVSLLNLSYNSFGSLQEDAFRSYCSAQRVYLHYCKLKYIDEKAFCGLENLKEVYLSGKSLTSIPLNLFADNHFLDKLILQGNDLSILQAKTPLLSGPSFLTVLDLNSCKLSNFDRVTISFTTNLTILDISNNELVVMDTETLSSQLKLEDVNLENNQWECGTEFEELLCWMHSKLPASHNRTIKCQYRKDTLKLWTPEERSSRCGSVTTPSATQSHESDVSVNTTVNATVNTPKSSVSEPDTSKADICMLMSVGLNIILIILLARCYICKYRRPLSQNGLEYEEHPLTSN
jgi:hypothetical protein